MDTDRLVHETTSLCRECKNAVPARVVALENGEVWMRKSCDRHGAQEVRLSTSAAWYQRTLATRTAANPPERCAKEIVHGCPFDCGPCRSHRQRIGLPIVTITSACNLECPICYVHNLNEDAYYMERDELAGILERLTVDHSGHLDVINMTGGDPTLHPEMFELLAMARAAGIHRVSICTNGMRLVEDETLVERLAELDARVALSFQSFETEADRTMQGTPLVEMKLRCLDILEKHGIDTTLIPVMTRGMNDHEIGRIIRLGLQRPNVRHLEIHTMTYTGPGGASFPRSGRISMYEVLERIDETTGGLLRPEHFVPSPRAHPLCYQVAYLLMDPEGGEPIPFLSFIDADEMVRCLSEHLYLEPSPRLERALLGAIDRLWSEGGDSSQRTLRILKSLLKSMFPRRPLSRKDALRAGELAAKAVYVHSHMDEETFDVERVAECCDSNCYADGTSIPVCTYNVLYREKEARFMTQPRQWNERSGGRTSFSNVQRD